MKNLQSHGHITPMRDEQKERWKAMTNNEVYDAVQGYRYLRAKSGCANDKKYWIAELFILRHMVDHNIIKNRSDLGKGNDNPELQAAYDNLRNGLETAMKFVNCESK